MASSSTFQRRTKRASAAAAELKIKMQIHHLNDDDDDLEPHGDATSARAAAAVRNDNGGNRRRSNTQTKTKSVPKTATVASHVDHGRTKPPKDAFDMSFPTPPSLDDRLPDSFLFSCGENGGGYWFSDDDPDEDDAVEFDRQVDLSLKTSHDHHRKHCQRLSESARERRIERENRRAECRVNSYGALKLSRESRDRITTRNQMSRANATATTVPTPEYSPIIAKKLRFTPLAKEPNTPASYYLSRSRLQASFQGAAGLSTNQAASSSKNGGATTNTTPTVKEEMNEELFPEDVSSVHCYF